MLDTEFLLLSLEDLEGAAAGAGAPADLHVAAMVLGVSSSAGDLTRRGFGSLTTCASEERFCFFLTRLTTKRTWRRSSPQASQMGRILERQ